jgi:hypothetical protein
MVAITNKTMLQDKDKKREKERKRKREETVETIPLCSRS